MEHSSVDMLVNAAVILFLVIGEYLQFILFNEKLKMNTPHV